MATTAPTTNTPTAAELAAQMATAAVPGMMKAVKNAKKIGMVLLALCLAITYPHAAEFLVSLPHVGSAGWVIAALFDLGMLILAQIIQTPGLVREAKTRATWLLVALGGIAFATQMAAPGATGIKLLFTSVVGLGLGTKWVIAAVRPDFEAIAEAEQAAAQTVAAVAPSKPSTRKCPQGCTCGKHAKKAPARKATTARKAPAARKTPAKATTLATPAELPRRVRTTGPVLPPATPLSELSDPAVLTELLAGLRNLDTPADLTEN